MPSGAALTPRSRLREPLARSSGPSVGPRYPRQAPPPRLRPRDPRRPDGSLPSPAPRACLTANAVAPTSRRSRRLAQAMKYWLLLQSRRPRSLACGSAWKHAPAPHARRSRTPSRTALLFSQSASVRTCPTLSLCSLVPSPKSSRPRQTPPTHESNEKEARAPQQSRPLAFARFASRATGSWA
jgi:hypothetical protein